jgi:flagellar motor switch protein FliG
LERIRIRTQGAPFDFLDEADPTQLANTLKNEHPQTVALIVSHLKATKAAALIANLDEHLQGEVANRIATMDRVSPDVIKEVENGIRNNLSSLLTQDYASSGGIPSLVSILHQVDRGTEKTIMDALDEKQPQVAEEVRQKMFIFENITTLDDRAIQRVLREVDNKDLILALKGASEEVQNLIFRNLSKRAADLLREDIAIIGPVRLRNVEEAQQRIVAVIRQLEAAEEIILSRSGEDEIIS